MLQLRPQIDSVKYKPNYNLTPKKKKINIRDNKIHNIPILAYHNLQFLNLALIVHM